MITLRHHLLTIVAVFLALAAGIVLGGGPLSDVGTRVANAGASSGQDPAAGDDAAAAYTESVVSALDAPVVGGRLADTSVTVLTLPGADEELVSALTGQVEASGGTVGARYDLAADLVDPGQKSLVDTLGTQLQTQQAKGDVPADATTYDRIGQLLGLASATTEAGAKEANGTSRAILDAFSGAGLIADPGDGDGGARSPLVLVVLGTDPATGEDAAATDGSDAILAGLVSGLARAATGVVVVGTTDDGGDGQLGRLRADPAAAGVATLDGVDTTAGRIATILTLQRSLTTPGGAFGASGSDGPLPLG